jgi:hypothetical protein
MFRGLSVLFLALSAWSCYSRDDASRGLLKSIANELETSSGNLRRNLKLQHDHKMEAFDACHLVSQHFGEDFLSGTSTTGGCKCDGSLDDTLTLDCDFENVCDDVGILCATVDVNVTLTNVLDENGSFGKDPKMSLASCVDTNVDFLDKMCLEMEFAKPEFFLPSACSFTYGNEKCICKIDDLFPCYDFDCSEVATSTAMARMLVSDSCKTVDLSGKNGVSMFLPALSELHGEKIADDKFFHVNKELSPMEEKFATWAETNGGE